MTRFLTMVSALALMAACDNAQPFDFGDTTTETPVDTDDDTGLIRSHPKKRSTSYLSTI